MLNVELTYPVGDGSYSSIAMPSLIDCTIGEESITGYSFWQIEGGTAKVTLPMFAQLRAVLDQDAEDYFNAEFRIYEGDTEIQENIFLGYLKRGNFDYADDGEFDPVDNIVTLTLHNPLKVIVESVNEDIPFVPLNTTDYYMIDFYLKYLLEYMVDRLSLNSTVPRTPFYSAIEVINAYNPLLTNPTTITGLILFDETNYPLGDPIYNYDPSFVNALPGSGLIQRYSHRRFKVEQIGDKDYFSYYRNDTKYWYHQSPGNSTRAYYAYSSVRSYKWEIIGSSIIPVAGMQAFATRESATNANEAVGGIWYTSNGQTIDAWLDDYNLINSLPTIAMPSSDNTFSLSGTNRAITVTTPAAPEPMTAAYAGQSGYVSVTFPEPIKSVPKLLKGFLKINLAALVCAYDRIIISNKIVDLAQFVPATNKVFAQPKISSGEYVNDTINADDLPFNNAKSIANGINEYFKQITKTELKLSINMEIDLNPISDVLTQTLSVGDSYQFGNIYIYITGITTDYTNRTAKIRGIGKVI